jgi:hypothetical protein
MKLQEPSKDFKFTIARVEILIARSFLSGEDRSGGSDLLVVRKHIFLFNIYGTSAK